MPSGGKKTKKWNTRRVIRESSARSLREISLLKETLIKELVDGSSCSTALSVGEDEGLGAWDEGENEDDDDVPLKGCVCGAMHDRPDFWIKCGDGSAPTCRYAWYNVAASCVGFDQEEAERMGKWSCRICRDYTEEVGPRSQQPDIPLLRLPDILLYQVLTFVSRPTDRVGVLCQQIVPLCSTLRDAVNTDGGSWNDIWSVILGEEYRHTGSPPNLICVPSDQNSLDHFNSVKGLRASKRQRVCSKRISRHYGSVRDVLKDEHQKLCGHTDDAHMALLSIMESNKTPLTLKRLRKIMSQFGPNLRINRPSPFGRTFLVECICANYVDERVILRCIKELVERHGANPDVITTGEQPEQADRAALFFAVARVMPSVIKFLLEVGASTSQQIAGRFRLVSDPSKSIRGTFSPLSFGIALREAEFALRKQDGGYKLPQHYGCKFNHCVSILYQSHTQEGDEDAFIHQKNDVAASDCF